MQAHKTTNQIRRILEHYGAKAPSLRAVNMVAEYEGTDPDTGTKFWEIKYSREQIGHAVRCAMNAGGSHKVFAYELQRPLVALQATA